MLAYVADSRRRLLPLLGLVLLLHGPFVGGGLMTDDFNHVDRAQRASLAAAVASPDPFGFYRPIPQLSFLIDARVFKSSPVAARMVNVLLHLAVVAAAFGVASMLLVPRAAVLATLAFALTPKAHGIAVLWISARSELFMALFALLAVASWIAWDRGRGRRYLVAACSCYALAFLSKESAALLPLLLLATPPVEKRSLRRRVPGLLALGGAAAVVFALRIGAGALMPTSGDAHYDLVSPLGRWAISVKNYLPRALPSPLALVLAALAGSALAAHSGRPTGDSVRPGAGVLALYSLVWFATFMIPVLPLVARSELYLYSAGFGLCLLAGHIADAVFASRRARALQVAVGIFTLAVGGYLVTRNLAIHDDLVFSKKFVDAIAASPALSTYKGAVLLVPADARSERSMRDAIGGYVTTVLHHALKRTDVYGWASYADPPAVESALQLQCLYRNGVVVLRAQQ